MRVDVTMPPGRLQGSSVGTTPHLNDWDNESRVAGVRTAHLNDCGAVASGATEADVDWLEAR